MEKKRLIFDLDRTLLTCNYQKVEAAVFEPFFRDKTELVMKNIAYLLDEYETMYQTYEDKRLSKFLTEKSGLEFTSEIIREWKNAMMSEADTMEEGVIELLDYLKGKNKSLVVLTNWYGKSQKARLRNAKIYDYFEDIFTGEYQLKPHPRAYINAMGKFNPRECVIIGDSISKDYSAPRLHGIEAILYDKDNIHDDNYVKVKKLTELKKKY